jgi:glucose-6-phosphate dehydrogenase assembly protein OpcA
VRALQIGDLPKNLLWSVPQPPPLAGALMYDLAEDAQQIVYDSSSWSDPVRGMAATAAWLEQVERPTPGGRWRVASDLNWRRLKYWRRLVAQALDPASAPGAAASVTEILVEHGPHAFIQAWHLVSWLSLRLGWRVRGGRVQHAVETTWLFTGPRGETRARVRRVEQGASDVNRVRIAGTVAGKPGAMDVTAESETRLAIRLEGADAAPRTVIVPPRTPAELIGRQLSDRERDPVFRESMAAARLMAESVLG